MSETKETKTTHANYSDWMGWATLISFIAIVLYGLSISEPTEIALQEAISIGNHLEVAIVEENSETKASH